MEIRSKISELRSKAKFIFLNKGLSVESVIIDKLPSKWEKFMNTEDEWIGVNIPESVDMSSCLYFGKYDSEFKGHKHSLNSEIMTVLNKGGEIHVFTPTREKIVKYGESIKIEVGEPHFVVFKGINGTLISVIWQPKMEGWTADFLKHK